MQSECRLWLCLPDVWRVHLCGCAGPFRTFRTCRMLAVVLLCRVPCLLSALLLYVCRVACKYGSISRFKGVFRGFWGCCVGLIGFDALRGLWGFCTRVELGGLKACGVFAFLFILLRLCLLSFCPFVCPLSCPLSCPFLLWLSFACPLAFLVCSCVLVGFCVCCCFFFPCGLYAKRAHLFCALSLLGFGVFILSYLGQ